VLDVEKSPPEIDFHQAVILAPPQMLVIGGGEDFGKSNSIFKLKLPDSS
jgi:hypothetical protein